MMAVSLRIVNLEENDSLTDLAEEVAATRQEILLRQRGRDVAVISPVVLTGNAEHSKERDEASRQAFLQSAGGWKDIVDEQLLDEIYQNRSTSSRHPVEF